MISLKSTLFWQLILAVVATTAIAALVTVVLTSDSSAFQRDLISAIEQQKFCVVTRDGTDGTDGKDGNDGADGQDGKDGTDGQPGATGVPGTCQIVIGPEGQIGATGPVGPAGPTGAKGDTGGITGYHGSFFDTTTQPIIAVNTPQAMRLNNGTNGAKWVSADQVSIVDDSRITFANPGVYNISFSAQMAKTAPGLDPVDMWLRYKGADLEWTNTEFPVDAVTKRYVAAWSFMIKVTNAYDWVELMWSTPEKTMEILSVPPQSNPTRPGIPSLLVSVQQVQ